MSGCSQHDVLHSNHIHQPPHVHRAVLLISACSSCRGDGWTPKHSTPSVASERPWKEVSASSNRAADSSNGVPEGTHPNSCEDHISPATSSQDADLDDVSLLLHFTDQSVSSSRSTAPQSLGALHDEHPNSKPRLRWAETLEAHSRPDHSPNQSAKPGKTCLKERSENHTFPYLEEAQAYEGAILLATNVSDRTAQHSPFRRSVWRSGHKRSRLSCHT
ncbi:hypothetical protein WJX84_002209 [Apatococcus fuscideae]|uniref:Uncharacterized protein n=1 Tax=Apatococcus fuscideae TaxID=2026836 RepID=A0AAW1TDC5_9CHLO